MASGLATRHFSGWLRRLRDPVTQTDLVQILKTVAAAVVAWVLAVHAFALEQPFLAPWAALLTVHASVYRTLSRGAQQVGATVLGVLVAFAAAALLGLSTATLAVTLLLGLILGGMSLLRDEGTTVATTALVVLTTGYGHDTAVLFDRLLDTGIGIGVGIVVNLIVLAPLNDRSAARQIRVIDDQVGQLLCEIAMKLREGPIDDDAPAAWIDRTRDLDHDIDHAWGVVRQSRETERLNPRRGVRSSAERLRSYGEVLQRLEQAVAETRSMARTLGGSRERHDEWDPRFRRGWLHHLEAAGEAILDESPAGVSEVRTFVDELTQQLSTEDLSALRWPLYGALIVNLGNILEALEDVAREQPELQRR